MKNIPGWEIRNKILLNLMYNRRLRFTQLWPKGVRSNTFNYHISYLIKNNYIKKNDNGTYSIGERGKDISVYINPRTLRIQKQPLIIVGLLIMKNKKVLLSQLNRMPFKDLFAISAVGKLKFGESLEECAKRMAKENLGYEVRGLKLSMFLSMKTFEDGRLKYHHHFYIFSVKKFRGDLIEYTLDRNNQWVNMSEVKKLDIFPDVPIIIKSVRGKFTYKEIVRKIKNGKFTRCIEL